MSAPIPYFDGHNDALLRLYQDKSGSAVADFLAGSAKGHIDLPRAREGGFVGGLFALFSPPAGKPPNFSPPPARSTYRCRRCCPPPMPPPR